MSVVPLFQDRGPESNPLYEARKRYGLTLLEASKAVEVSTSLLEREEASAEPSIDPGIAASKYELFLARDKDGMGRNLLFGVMPLRVARDIMGLSVDAIAGRYGMSPSHWRKLECHAREVSQDLRIAIERDVRSSFERICDSA